MTCGLYSLRSLACHLLLPIPELFEKAHSTFASSTRPTPSLTCCFRSKQCFWRRNMPSPRFPEYRQRHMQLLRRILHECVVCSAVSLLALIAKLRGCPAFVLLPRFENFWLAHPPSLSRKQSCTARCVFKTVLLVSLFLAFTIVLTRPISDVLPVPIQK